jgi:predicted amidohydrolase
MNKIIALCLFLTINAFHLAHAKEIKVAAIEFNPIAHNVDANVQGIVDASIKASQNGAKLMVFPEAAVTGFITFKPSDFDTIPGKATAAIAKVTKKYNNYVVVGMYERDVVTGFHHNSAVLIGPQGLVGKYRKNQIPAGDFETSVPGNLGFPVFDTEIGKIAMTICFDDSRLQSLLIPSLRNADILATPIGSDMMPRYEKSSAMNHSTIANIAVLAGWTGMSVVASNQTGILSAPQLNYLDQFTGGSMIWDNSGKQLSSSRVSTWTKPLPPQTIYATLDLSKKSEQKAFWLKHRRPELYQIYNLYKAPVDPAANNAQNQISALLLQYDPINGNVSANASKVDQLISNNQSVFNLAVLPFNSFIGKVALNKANIAQYAESLDGKSAGLAADIAKKYKTYLLFSMPELKDGKYYETAILFDFNGKQAGVYRKSHLNDQEAAWATAGNDLPIFNTNDLGRVAVMLNDEVRIPELAEVYALNRADLILIPAAYEGKEYGGEVNIPKGLVPDASNRGMYIWYDIAKYSQAFTLVANYRDSSSRDFVQSALYSLVPEENYYPPNIAPNKEVAHQVTFTTNENKTLWINQQGYVTGRRYDLAGPLTLDMQSACFKEWQKDSTNKDLCPKTISGK